MLYNCRHSHSANSFHRCCFQQQGIHYILIRRSNNDNLENETCSTNHMLHFAMIHMMAGRYISVPCLRIDDNPHHSRNDFHSKMHRNSRVRTASTEMCKSHCLGCHICKQEENILIIANARRVFRLTCWNCKARVSEKQKIMSRQLRNKRYTFKVSYEGWMRSPWNPSDAIKDSGLKERSL